MAGSGARRLMVSTIIGLALVGAGCGRAPGSLRGELARQTGEAAAAVASAELALQLWSSGRLGTPQVRVLLTDMVGEAVAAYSAIAALDAAGIWSDRDVALVETAAAGGLLARARSAIVDGPTVVARLQPGLAFAVDRLNRLSDDPTAPLPTG
jgi:hypothetical protein